jgi:hypothetical protein
MLQNTLSGVIFNTAFLPPRELAMRGEIFIILHPADFVKRNFPQKSSQSDPKICATLPIDFSKFFCYNYYTR